MKLSVHPQAARWYRQELQLRDGDCVRFVVQLYGHSIHPNYSLGIAVEPPRDPGIQTVSEGIMFYFEKQDDWFLEGHRLNVTPHDDGVDFHFEPVREVDGP